MITRSEMVTLEQIKTAHRNLSTEIVRTPLLLSADLNERLNTRTFLKAENLQVTGSYKSRAAFTMLNNLTPQQKEKGAALSSSGNFAGAFALMGRLLGIPVSVVMMEKTAPFKIEKTRRYGAEVVMCENRFAARFETLERLERERGIVAINHFEDPDVIAGHGTIGLEISEELPDAATILVPISSGGLIAGVATAVKEIAARVKVIGVQPEGANATYLSFKFGEIQSIEHTDTICDALVATQPGRLPFAHIQHYVDDIVTVTDDAVKAAVRLLFETTKLVVEPSGAVGVAALLSGAVSGTDNTAVLLSGGNVSKENYARVLAE